MFMQITSNTKMFMPHKTLTAGEADETHMMLRYIPSFITSSAFYCQA